MHQDIIITGAGAAGLIAAYELTKAGKKVLILEARDRCGGRIHTVTGAPFSESVELGAEFIHGDLPVTLNLLKEAGIELQPAGGEMWQHREGKFEPGRDFMEGWDLLMEKLAGLQNDVPINEFLEKELPGDAYSALRQSVRGFVSGYDSADPDKASTFALRREWMEEEGAQRRVKGGYGRMIAYLESEIAKNGGAILFEQAVKQIEWRQSSVSVKTAGGNVFSSEKVIIALPLGVLLANPGETAAIRFVPEIAEQRSAMHKIGFGSVIKILLEFKTAFWRDGRTAKLAGRDPKKMSFVLSNEAIPAWWTQAPHTNNLLTGWLSGPPAEAKKNLPEDELLRLALQSLSNIFKRSVGELQNNLQASHIVNWTKEPFTLGSYDYDMLESSAARKILANPVADTLFFAGEYAYEGPAMGTVEAALNAGKMAAEKILS